MSDISYLQQQWQSAVDGFLADKGQATKQSLAYDEAEKKLRDKMKRRHGLKRLTNIFTKVFKLSSVHRKQKKLRKHARKERQHIEGDAASTYASLGETLVRGSSREALYNHLGGIYDQIDRTRDVVLNAASQCSSASSDETFAAMDDKNMFVDMMAQGDANRAASAVEYAKEAVENLQQRFKSLPQVDSSFANEIRSLSSSAFFADMFGGFWGTFANWNAASRLDDAEYHLNNVASELGSAMGCVRADMSKVRQEAIAEARQGNPEVKKLASSIESYLPRF